MLDKNITFGGVFFMEKYAVDLKIEVIQYYFNDAGYGKTTKHFLKLDTLHKCDIILLCISLEI